MNSDELKVILEQHRIWVETGHRRGRQADLSVADLSGADLSKANLSGADLSEANLRWADLSVADLSEANLSEADLRWADLRNTNFNRANLINAKLSEATTSDFVFVGCIGSANRMTTYHISTDTVFCGCFDGTLLEFESKVKEVHKDNPVFLAEYLAAVSFIKAVVAARKEG